MEAYNRQVNNCKVASAASSKCQELKVSENMAKASQYCRAAEEYLERNQCSQLKDAWTCSGEDLTEPPNTDGVLSAFALDNSEQQEAIRKCGIGHDDSNEADDISNEIMNTRGDVYTEMIRDMFSKIFPDVAYQTHAVHKTISVIRNNLQLQNGNRVIIVGMTYQSNAPYADKLAETLKGDGYAITKLFGAERKPVLSYIHSVLDDYIDNYNILKSGITRNQISHVAIRGMVCALLNLRAIMQTCNLTTDKFFRIGESSKGQDVASNWTSWPELRGGRARRSKRGTAAPKCKPKAKEAKPRRKP
jgi:hypothetical protein